MLSDCLEVFSHLEIPVLDRKRVCDGEPIPMDFEVCRLADS